MGLFNIKKKIAETFVENSDSKDEMLYVGLILNVEKDGYDVPYVDHVIYNKYNFDLYLLPRERQNYGFGGCTKPIGVSIFKMVGGCAYDILNGEVFPIVYEKNPYSSSINGQKKKTYVAIPGRINKSGVAELFNRSILYDIKNGDFKFDYDTAKYDKEVYDICTTEVLKHIEEYNQKNYEKITVRDIFRDPNISLLDRESGKPANIKSNEKYTLSPLERKIYETVDKKFTDLAIKNTTELNKKIVVDYLIDKDIKAMNKFKNYNQDNFNRIVELLKEFYGEKSYKEVFQYIPIYNKHREKITTYNKDFYLNIMEKAKAPKPVKQEEIVVEPAKQEEIVVPTVEKVVEPAKQEEIIIPTVEKVVEPVKQEENKVEPKQEKVNTINISTTGKTIEQIANEMTLLSKMGIAVYATYDNVEFSTEFLNNETEIIEYFFAKKYNLEPKNENVKKHILK